MYIIKIDNLYINLVHMICAEDSVGEPPPLTIPEGIFRLTLVNGRILDLTGTRAESARILIDAVAIHPRPAQPAHSRSQREAIHGHDVGGAGEEGGSPPE